MIRRRIPRSTRRLRRLPSLADTTRVRPFPSLLQGRSLRLRQRRHRPEEKSIVGSKLRFTSPLSCAFARTLAPLLVGTSLVLCAAPAFADPSLADRETARSLMDEGDKKRDANDWKAALKS